MTGTDGRSGAAGLLERDAELSAIDAALRAARSGDGAMSLITGPPGIGKSALLAEASRRGRELGATVITAAGQEIAREYPWSAAIRLFSPLLERAGEAQRQLWFNGAAGIVQELLEGRGGGPGGDPFPLLHGLHWLAVNLAAEASVLLIADDLQWFDLPSLRFVAYLGERVGDAPIAIIGAIRDGEPDAPARLLDAVAAHATTRLTPAPLSERATAQIVTSALPEAEAGLVSACQHATGGNPLLLTQLLTELHAAGDAVGSDVDAVIAGAGPNELVRTVARRLQRLGPDAQALARAAAALGPSALTDVATLAALDLRRAGAATDVLVAGSVLAGGDPLRFVHPLMRSAVYASMTDSQRGWLHLRGAELLRDRARGTQRVATQLLEATPSAEPWVVEALREAAADASAGGSPDTAARYLRRALEEPCPAAQRAGVLLALAGAEAAGRESDGIAAARAAVAESAPGPERGAANRLLGRLLYIAGRPAPAIDAFQQAIGESDDPELALEIEAEQLTVMRLHAGPDSPAYIRGAELRSRQFAGDTPAQRKMLAILSDQAQWAGEPREPVLDLARRALGNGRLLAEETVDGMTWIGAAGSLGWLDELEEYQALTERVVADARRRGSASGHALAAYMRSFASYYSGNLAGALADLEITLGSREIGWAQFITAAYAQTVWALLERNDLDAAESMLAEGETDAHSAPTSMLREAKARLLLIRGRPDEALAVALEGGRIAVAAGLISPAPLPWRGTAAIAAARAGDPARAAELAEEEIALARRIGAPRVLGMALRAAGVARGDDTGIHALQEAVAVLEGSPSRLELARARIDLGAALRRSGARVEAREPLRAGLELAVDFGARRLEDQARAELTASGARVRSAQRTGADSLTPSERRVATMAADGLTSAAIAQALFVSRRTVDTQLGSVYRKLGIASRSELPGALTRRHRDDDGPEHDES